MRVIQNEAELSRRELAEVKNEIGDVTASTKVLAQGVQTLQEISGINQSTSDQIGVCSQSLGSHSESLSRLMSSVLGLAFGRSIRNVPPKALDRTLHKYVPIDVRRANEFNDEYGHLAGANLLTLDEHFEEKLGRLDPKISYVFVCRSGGRSERAARTALRRGFRKITNLEGGMIAWQKENLPVSRN